MAFTVESPSVLPAGRAGPRAIALIGDGTSWSSSTTFSLTGLPVTLVEAIVSGPGVAELVVTTAGSGAGTLTIHDGSGATATVQVHFLPPARHRWFPQMFRRDR